MVSKLSSKAVKLLIEKEIQQNSVMIFSKSYCPYCKTAKATL